MSLLLKFAIGIGALIMGGMGGMLVQNKAPVQGNFNPAGAGTYLLQSSISATQTSLTLTSFTEPGSGIPYTMAYMGTDIQFGTISPSSGNSEFVSFTGITQNANQTATLTGIKRGLARTPGVTGCVASTTLAHAYPGQTQFILSNSPCFYLEFAIKQNAQTIGGLWTYSSTSVPKLDQNPSTAGWALLSTSTFATVGYVNDTTTSGAPNASESVKGIVQLATQTQMGSSTGTGSTGAFLSLYTKYSTSSPSVVCGVCTVETDADGKINQGFINLAESLTWTALQTFSGGLTSTGTTTISASGVVTNPLVLNGIPYSFPSAQGASSSLLTTNGSGTVIWGNPFDKVIYQNTNVSQSTTASATTTLATAVIPANTLGSTPNRSLRITGMWAVAGASSGCLPDIEYGNGSATTTVGYIPSNVFGGPLQQITTIIYATSTTAQASFSVGTAFTNIGSASIPPLTGSGAYTTFNLAANTYIGFAAKSVGGPTCQFIGGNVEVLSI